MYLTYIVNILTDISIKRAYKGYLSESTSTVAKSVFEISELPG